jgi:hypothetical protein
LCIGEDNFKKSKNPEDNLNESNTWQKSQAERRSSSRNKSGDDAVREELNILREIYTKKNKPSS